MKKNVVSAEVLQTDGTFSKPTLTLYYDAEERRAQIEDILSQGKIAVFTDGNLIKKVNKWKTLEEFPDDLESFESNGLSKYVNWRCIRYKLTEETPQDEPGKKSETHPPQGEA